MSKKAAIYARVSTEGQEERGTSLDGQLRDGRAYAEQHGYSVVAEFREVYSGAELFRPELDKLREMLGVLDAVIVYEPDRLTRGGILHEMLLEDEFSKAGCEVEFIIGGAKPRTPEEKLTRDLQAVVKQYEREIIKRRMGTGRRRGAESGKVMSVGVVNAPYGYTYNPQTKRLEVIEAEAKIVKLIYEWYVYGENGKHLGQTAIATRLYNMQVSRKRAPRRNQRKTGAWDWNQSTISAILRNETYAGVWHYGKHVSTGKTTQKLRDRSEWIAVEVPTIVSRELWQLAQDKRSRNAELSRRNTPDGVFLMLHRLSCAKCGCKFHSYTDSRKRKHQHTYMCHGQFGRNMPDNIPVCSRRLVSKDIDTLIWSYLENVMKHPEFLLEALTQKRQETEQSAAQLRGYLQTTNNVIERLERKQTELLDLYLDDSTAFPKELLQRRLNEISQELERAEREKASFLQRLNQVTITEAQAEQIQAFCAEMRKGIEYFTFEDKLEAIELLDIRGVVHRGETPQEDTITLSGLFPTTILVQQLFEDMVSKCYVSFSVTIAVPAA